MNNSQARTVSLTIKLDDEETILNVQQRQGERPQTYLEPSFLMQPENKDLFLLVRGTIELAITTWHDLHPTEWTVLGDK